MKPRRAFIFFKDNFGSQLVIFFGLYFLPKIISNQFRLCPCSSVPDQSTGLLTSVELQGGVHTVNRVVFFFSLTESVFHFLEIFLSPSLSFP